MAVKSERLAVRLSPRQDDVIRHAAEVEDMTVTDFTVAAAVTHAQDVLADRRRFVLDESEWTEFLARLDRPVDVDKPVLEKLLGEPSVFDRSA